MSEFKEQTTPFHQFLKPKKTIAQVMRETGLSRPTIMLFLAGKFGQLSVKNMKILCNAYGVSLFIQKWENDDFNDPDFTEYHIV